MIREKVTLDETIEYLNELIDRDAPAVAALIANRVPCNEDLADHPSAQCRQQHGGFNVGMLGIINGLFGAHDGGYRTGWGPIMFVFDEGNLVRVERSKLEPGTDNL